MHGTAGCHMLVKKVSNKGQAQSLAASYLHCMLTHNKLEVEELTYALACDSRLIHLVWY